MESGTKTGHYKIVRPLGAGGMGEVYLAEDTRLNREIAIKVLPDRLRHDPERLSRFRREAQAAARLKHPNIATIHALEEFDDQLLITMEHVEGQSLKALIPRGGMELSTFFDTFIPLADALSHAHEQGRVHRDLKPDNILVETDGTPKILDFGLVRIISTDISQTELEPGEANESDPPLTSDSGSDAPTRMGSREGAGPAAGVPSLTRGGQLIGTPQYMSPEQAEGETTDARTDLFSLGVVMYEALTGRRPFEGKTLESIIGRIIEAEPTPVATLKPETPYALGTLVRKCLRKQRDLRLQSARELHADLLDIRREVEAGTVLVEQSSASVSRSTLLTGKRFGWLAAGAVALVVAAAVFARITTPAPERPLRRFELPVKRLPTGAAALYSGPSISPDGKRVAYIDEDALWVRDLDRLEPRLIENTAGAHNPFWSPESDFIGYAKGRTGTGASSLWKVSLDGRLNNELCDLPFGFFMKGVWGRTGEIVYMVRFQREHQSLSAVSERGGTPRVLIDSETHELDNTFWLAAFYVHNGQTLVLAYRDPAGRTHLQVGEVEGSREVDLEADAIGRGRFLQYSSSGHLLFDRSSSLEEPADLWATPFSLSSMTTTGPSFLVAHNATHASVSLDGTLVYQVGDSEPIDGQQLVWVDRNGSLQETIGQVQFRIRNPVLSPDERRVAVRGDDAGFGQGDIWLHEVDRPIKMRLTSQEGFDEEPSWSPDGQQIVWASDEILVTPVDARGTPRRLVEHGSYPSFSSDGEFLVYHAGTTVASSNSRDIWYLPLSDDAEPVAFLQTDFEEGVPVLSPDGRYLAYMSDESGRFEVYLQRFPQGGDKRQLSLDGGNFPRWNGAGDELFYVSDNTLMSVPVGATDGLRVGTPTPLFDGDNIDVNFNTHLNLRTTFDVSQDGERFVVIQDIKAAPSVAITVVENWYEDFKDLD